MTMLYPFVLEIEENGAVSAYVPGRPVYAAADSHAEAERAIRGVLAEYLNAHPASRPGARVRVARVSDRGKTRVSVVGLAALVGQAQRREGASRACQWRTRRAPSETCDHTADWNEDIAVWGLAGGVLTDLTRRV